MSVGNPYAVFHLEISGRAPVDRDDPGELDLALELDPIGTELPPGQQTRELVLKIAGRNTTLNEEGIVALREFLDMRPTAWPAGTVPVRIVDPETQAYLGTIYRPAEASR